MQAVRCWCGDMRWVVLRDEDNREYVLTCGSGHEARRFFVLHPPDPARGPHAAAR
jgi:hypothetical protein